MAASLVAEAELFALNWVVLEAVSRGWRNLIFSSDAFNLTKEINAKTDPQGWFIRSYVLNIRNALTQFGWKLE